MYSDFSANTLFVWPLYPPMAASADASVVDRTGLFLKSTTSPARVSVRWRGLFLIIASEMASSAPELLVLSSLSMSNSLPC